MIVVVVVVFGLEAVVILTVSVSQGINHQREVHHAHTQFLAMSVQSLEQLAVRGHVNQDKVIVSDVTVVHVSAADHEASGVPQL